MPPTLAPIRHAIERYRARVELEWPGRLRRMVLFGSHARGEAHEGSDVDVLVLLADATHAERARAIDIGGELGFELGLAIAPLVQTQSEWDELVRRERRLVTEIETDGVEVLGEARDSFHRRAPRSGASQ